MTLERLTQITSVGISSGITLSSATLTGVTTLTTASASGNISAVDGTFSGDLNVAGTLTYEDVSNIDSVGVITARSGLHVTGGSVGIATDNPAEKLEVYGNVRFKDPDGSHGIEFYPDVAGLGYQRIISYNRTSSAYESLSIGVDNFIVTQGSSSERLRINSSGKIGIGTDNPQQPIHLLASNPAIRLQDTGSNTSYAQVSGNGGKLYLQADDNNVQGSSAIEFHLDGDVKALINSSGNIGIGSETPRYGLDVYTNNILVSGSSAGNLILEDRGVADGSRPFALLASNDGNFTITNANRNASGTTTSSVERLRIASDGVVTIPGHPIMEVYTVTSASRSVTGNTNTTLIPFNAANTYDPGGDMNVTTGVYTVPADGRYLLHYGTDGKTAANANAGSIYYALNGTENLGQCLYYGDAYSGNFRQLVLNLSANDTIHFHIRGNNSQAYTVNNAYYGICLIG